MTNLKAPKKKVSPLCLASEIFQIFKKKKKNSLLFTSLKNPQTLQTPNNINPPPQKKKNPKNVWEEFKVKEVIQK